MNALIFYCLASLLVASAIGAVFAKNTIHAVLFLIFAIFNVAGLFLLLGAELLAMMLIIVYVGAVAMLFLFIVMMLDISNCETDNIYKFNRWKYLKTNLRGISCYVLLNLVLISVAIYTFDRFIYIGRDSYRLIDYLSMHNIFSSFIITMISLVTTRYITRINVIDILRSLFEGLPTVILIGLIIAACLTFMILFSSVPERDSISLIKDNYKISAVSNVHDLASLIYNDYAVAFIAIALVLLTAMIGAIVLTIEKHNNTKKQDIARQLSRDKQHTIEIRKVKIGEGI